MIREVILGAGAMYLIILIAQIIQRPSVGLEAILAGSVLAVAMGVYLSAYPYRIHAGESVAVWTGVLLFLVYGLFKYLTGAP
jgi:hypothetical protein